MEADITKGVDLVAWEKPLLNKCHSNQGRRTAYGLLLSLCQSNPRIIPEIIKNYYAGMLVKIKKPKKGAGGNPKLESRVNGYCGLRNLGCICYMNSMI
jgi:hypothetical protein